MAVGCQEPTCNLLSSDVFQVKAFGIFSPIDQINLLGPLQSRLTRPSKVSGWSLLDLMSSTALRALTFPAYVPYQLWYESDPTITAIVQGSLSDYRHELLLENSRGIPVHQQHGSLDDNVPPRHSRRMSQLLSQIGCASEYTELPAKNHWFEGVMTTQNLLRFYDKILENRLARKPIPSTFEFVVVNPGTMGSKYGIVVDQLTSPERPGMLSGNFNPEESSLHLHTSNVHRLHFLPTIPIEWLGSNIIVDGSRIQLLRDVPNLSQWLLRLTNGSWMVC